MNNSFRDKVPLVLGGAIGFALVLGGVFIWQKKSWSPSEVVSTTPAPVEAALSDWPEGHEHRFTDGMPVRPEDQPKSWFAVMIENSAEAWPLTGIASARLVIEAPVEGSIPRLSAYFDDTQDIKKIGPVRSVRPYYLDWAMGQGAMLAHVGGSPEALALVTARKSVSLNEFFWGRFFWRDLARYAPHNVYTSIGLLKQGFDARGYEVIEQPLPSFTYTRTPVVATSCASVTSIAVPFSGLTDDYTANWSYRLQTQDYVRQQGTSAVSLDEEVDIVAKNIVVLFTDIRVIDDEGRRSIRTIGEGKMSLYRDGQAFTGQWEKESLGKPLRLLNDSGDEIALRPGTTWVEVVSLSTSVKTDVNQDCE